MGSPALARIREAGVIRIGIGTFGPPFSLTSDGGYDGFEFDLARRIVELMLGNAFEIEWIEVGAVERFSALENGTIDLLMKFVAVTRTRIEEYATFSVPYFLDGAALVVRADSGIWSSEDLEATLLTGPYGSDFSAAAIAYVEDRGASWVSDDVEVDRADLDGCLTDWLSALLRIHDNPELRAVWLYADAPVAVGVRRGDTELAAVVSEAIGMILDDGYWETLIVEWLPGSMPWTVDEMRTFPLADR